MSSSSSSSREAHSKKNVFELKSSSAKQYEALREDAEEADINENNTQHYRADESVDSKSNSSDYPTTLTTSFNDDDDDDDDDRDRRLDFSEQETRDKQDDNSTMSSSSVESLGSRRLVKKLAHLRSASHSSDHDDDNLQESESKSFIETNRASKTANGNKSNNLGMRRTISQSMLELDDHLKGSSSSSSSSSGFEVVWSGLDYSYEPSWWNRRAARGGPDDARRPAANHVLKNISGRFKSNQLIAIIGPSGCGKTTLLQFLAGNNGEHRERMRIVGLDEPKVAFIGQHDGLLPGLTARETLVYASRLQNARSPRPATFDHEQHILPILSELGLLECAHRSVTKLSGGQAKRVTIAQELLYPTNLLILDEVTSGLDASTSYAIVKLLKYLVAAGDYPMSIVMSIHQPSARLFAVFDQVYVMSEGHCLYEGSCQVDQINEHLSKFNLDCPKYHNIADYLIELACDESLLEVREQMIQYHNKTSAFHQRNKNYSYSINSIPLTAASRDERNMTKGQECQATRTQLEIPMDFSLHEAIEKARASRQRPFGQHFVVHFSRSLLRIRRSYILTYLQLVTYIILGLQLATFYGPQIGVLSGCPRLPGNLMSYILTSNYDHSSSSSTTTDQDEESSQEMRRIQENMNFLLVAVMTATFAALEITVITFPLEAKTVKREWRNGWYRVSSYFMGRTLADLPFQLVFVVIFCLIVYILTGQIGLNSWRFVSFVAIIAMVALVAQSFGFMFGALFMDNLPAAVFTAPLCIFPTLLFSGFFSRVSQIPPIYKPLTYLSHFRYAFDSLLVTLYGYERCDCDQDQLDRYHNSSSGQADSMREMFKYLFGSNESCNSATDDQDSSATTMASNADQDNLISSEDLAAIQVNRTLAEAVASATRQPTGAGRLPGERGSLAMNLAKRVNVSGLVDRGVEDALVDSVFEHMLAANNATSASLPASNITQQSLVTLMPSSVASAAAATTTTSDSHDVMDHLAGKFAHRMTQMLNKQSNFGHPLPTQCSRFNSYLMTEFDLDNNDLIFGLIMLLAMVLITRLVCNLILNFTIANRAN